jgi:hypothetical protein
MALSATVLGFSPKSLPSIVPRMDIIYFAVCLLVNKLKDTYRTLFTKINEISCNFAPKKIIVDFEVAIHNAAQVTWPSAQIVGCRFHLTQNWCVFLKY